MEALHKIPQLKAVPHHPVGVQQGFERAPLKSKAGHYVYPVTGRGERVIYGNRAVTAIMGRRSRWLEGGKMLIAPVGSGCGGESLSFTPPQILGLIQGPVSFQTRSKPPAPSAHARPKIDK